MNILFISEGFAEISIAERLADEGNAVKFFERDEKMRGKITRLGLKFVDDWKSELTWVGKKGLIVFDDAGMGTEQDSLREKGYSVFGGCEAGERLELNRQYGQKIFSFVGLKIVESLDFYNIKEMIAFLKKDKRKWVLKQNGSLNKGLNYVSQLEGGEDIASILKNYGNCFKSEKFHFDLQEKIEGIEIAVGRFFNGNDWVGPICVNIEHKNLFNNDLGPKTHEMGNLMWYDENEKNKLFLETLNKMKMYLQKVDFRGYFDINCIVNKRGAFPLEATARLGHPTMQLQDTIHISKWGEFLKAVADGKPFDLKYRKGFATVAFVGVPPYPYKGCLNQFSSKGIEIFFKKKMTKEEMGRVYFEEVNVCKKDNELKFEISSNSGYIAHISGIGKTVQEAREKMYKLIEKMVIPKMFYRTDIGLKFIEKDRKKLEDMGWI